MTAGLETEMFEPGIGTCSKTMHGAVQMDGGDFLMDLQDPIDHGHVFDVGRAFIVNDDIIVFGPIQLSIERQYGCSRRIIGPIDIDLDMSSFLNSLSYRFLLPRVIVATSARDQ